MCYGHDVRYLRWNRAGAICVGAPRAVLFGFVLVGMAVFGGCSEPAQGAEGAVPTPEFPTSLPTPTARPTTTPSPTPEPTATPTPTPTPTARDIHGPLLVEGPYDWPTDMPDDLTADEIFAVNVFASAQNADFATLAAQSDFEEYEPVLPYTDVIILDATKISIGELQDENIVDRKALPTTGFLKVRSIERTDQEIVLRTCEHIDFENVHADGSTSVERGTGERLIRFARTETGTAVRYVGWRVDRGVEGELVECSD